MAAQCGLNPSFVSSNAYYGYVPVAQSAKLEMPASRPAADANDMDVDAEPIDTQQNHRVACARKRGFGHDELAAYMPRLKRLREETVVTNVFSMMQETASVQKNVDWPRCTMSRRYYA